jgi:hypothetical protein
MSLRVIRQRSLCVLFPPAQNFLICRDHFWDSNPRFPNRPACSQVPTYWASPASILKECRSYKLQPDFVAIALNSTTDKWIMTKSKCQPFFGSKQSCALWQLQTSPAFWNFNHLFMIRRTFLNTILFTVTALTNSNLTSIFLPLPQSTHHHSLTSLVYSERSINRNTAQRPTAERNRQ